MTKKLTYEELELKILELEREINLLKQREKAFFETEAKYANFLDYAPIGILTVNMVGQFTYANRKLQEIMGYKMKDCLNKPFYSIVHPDDREILNIEIQKAMAGQHTAEPYEIRIFHESGEILWIRITSESIHRINEGGQKTFVGMQYFVEDITGMKESQERFKETVELLPNIVCEYDITGRFTYVNSYGLEALGYTRTDLEEGLHASQVFSREELSRFKDRFGMLLTGKTIPPTQYRIKCKDNTIIEVIAASSPMFKKGKIVGARSSVTPITELKRIENELKESEAKYRDLANSLPQIIYEADLEGNVTFANRMAFEIFGYEKDDLGKDQNALQMLIPEDRQRAVDNIQKVLTGKPIGNREYTAQRRDGSTFPIEALSAPIIHEGKPVGFRGVIIDLSDRRCAEEHLRKSEERYRLLAENATDIIARHTLDGQILYVSPAVQALLGYEPEFLLGRNGFELITHPDDMETVRNSLKKLVDEQRSQIRMDFRIKRQDGEHTYVESTVRRLVKETSGDDYELQSITRDITDRKIMEEELRESEAKYRLLFQNAPAGIYEFDMTTLRFISVNEVMCEYTGYSEDEFLALDPFLLLTEESKATLNGLLNEVFAGNQNPDPVEYRIKGKNGREFWILVNSRFFFEEGIPKRATAVVYDITELKKAEEERTKLEKQLQQAHRLESIGTLAGGIAHDFNNLLMGIQGRTSLILMDTDISHRHREHLRGIEEYVERAANLTSQLLGFARGGKYEVKPVNLNDLLKESSEMFGRTKKEIIIHHKYQKDLWAVEADQGQIEQVLMNLYVNAWQAMPSGGELYLQTENVRFDENDVKPFEVEPGRYVKISVTDTGIGMDEATRQRIFDPFFTTKEVGRGTGLGLASAYGIIKNHSGFISVFSEKGEGTMFTIYLPASESEVVRQVVPVEDVQTGSETILLVDDEEMILEVGKEILHSLGYQVLIARGGYEAIELYEKSKDQIDMVILDMVMPDISGGDTYDRLKAMSPEVKALLSSGYSISGQATEILDRGCNGFIQKPFKMKELSHKLREVLDKK